MPFRLILCCLALSVAGFTSSAQSQEPRTIRVKRESQLVKAQFDNTELRLFAVDRFGNMRDNRIVGYTLYVKGKKGTEAFRGFSNDLTGEMVTYLNKQKVAVKIFFTEITVLDDQEHPQRLPDVIEVWFPQCGNCSAVSGQRNKRRR